MCNFTQHIRLTHRARVLVLVLVLVQLCTWYVLLLVQILVCALARTTEIEAGLQQLL